MLVRQGGRPLFQVNYAPVLSSQMFTEEASYAHSPPDIEKVVAQEDWRKGMGEEKYDDAKRYAQSIGADARFRERIVLGPKENATTALAAAAYTLFNAGFETAPDTQLTGWVRYDAADTFAQEATVIQSGTYSLKVTADGVSTGAKQTVAVGCAFNGKTVTATCYLRSPDTVAGLVLYIELYEEGVLKASAKQDPFTANTWYQLTASYAATSATARKLEIRAFLSAATGARTVYLDTATLTFATALADLTLGTPACFEEYEGAVYVGTTTGLWKWSTANTRWERVAGSPDQIEWLEALGLYLYLARGANEEWWYYDSDVVAPFVEKASHYASYFVAIGSALWRAVKPYTVGSCASPPTGAWSDVTVGEVAYTIMGLANHRNTCYIGKENGLYKVSDSTVTEIAPELRTLYNTRSGRNLFAWKDYLYIPFGRQALYQYDGAANAIGTVNPAAYSLGITTYSGQILALWGDEEYLFAFVVGNTDKVELLCGRYETVDGSTDWAWHPIYELSGTDVAHCFISSVTSPPRLWFATGTSVKYLIIPDKYADITKATGYTFGASGYLITGNYDFGFVININCSNIFCFYKSKIVTLGVEKYRVLWYNST